MKKNTSFIWPVLFVLFWIILCERLTMEVLILGIVISASVYYLNRHTFPFVNFRMNKILLYFLYALLLLKEIVLANISVARIVLSPKMHISPCIVRVKTQLKSDFHRAILANSITLTPGTVTLQLNGDELVVHCLVREYIPSLLDSQFEKLLLKLEV